MPSLAEQLPSQPDPNDPSWRRADGSLKGMGYWGPLRFHDGRTSSELSLGVDVHGMPTEIPALVPTLQADEIAHLLGGGKPTMAIIQKAVGHARSRVAAGRPVFADERDQPLPLPGLP